MISAGIRVLIHIRMCYPSSHVWGAFGSLYDPSSLVLYPPAPPHALIPQPSPPGSPCVPRAPAPPPRTRARGAGGVRPERPRKPRGELDRQGGPSMARHAGWSCLYGLDFLSGLTTILWSLSRPPNGRDDLLYMAGAIIIIIIWDIAMVRYTGN